MIYLDNAATTQISEEVLDAMMPYLKDKYGNAGSIHQLGRQANAAVDKARRQVADFMGVSPQDIIFTAGGTEANNLVIQGIRNHFNRSGKCYIVTSEGEHDSILNCLEHLLYYRSIYSFIIPLSKRGDVNIHELLSTVNNSSPFVGLVSLMRMNNETGIVNNILNIAPAIREKGILFHSDCVQAAGIEPLEPITEVCDFVSISSHKIHGPKGVGALFVRDKSTLDPLISGGSVQEFGLRGGTENVAGIVGFGEACRLAKLNMKANVEKITSLSNTFKDTLFNQFQFFGMEDCVHLNGSDAYRNPKTMSIRFSGVPADTLIMMLDANGICVSAGSACTAHDDGLSHVLKSMGLSNEEIRSSIRVSFSAMNTFEEVTQAAVCMAACVMQLRQR